MVEPPMLKSEACYRSNNELIRILEGEERVCNQKEYFLYLWCLVEVPFIRACNMLTVQGVFNAAPDSRP